MERSELSKSQAAEYQRHYERAWTALKKVMISGTRPAVRVSEPDAREAIQCFTSALKLVPNSWPSMWGTGKAHQVLGEHAVALTWFERTLQMERGNPDIWREAAAEALAMGDGSKAVQYARCAVDLQPRNAGLHANLALAFLIAGRDDEARTAAQTACGLDANDDANGRVLRLVDAVIHGEHERPRSL